LLGNGGDLISAYEELAPTWSIDRSHWLPNGLRTQLFSKAGMGAWARRAEASDVQDFASSNPSALVYANSIGSARVIDVLAPEVPVLTHVHELEFMFQALSSPPLGRLVPRTRQFIACSNAVRENLIRKHGVTPERIETVHESIPVNEVRAERSRQQVLQELRIPDDALLIVGSGTVDWRKGTDLFIQLARAVCQERSHAYFVWVGGGSKSEFEYDVGVSGLTEKMRLTGVVVKPADYLAAADVFVLTSREDPYPLVCLEAAALDKPIVCFANAGGMPEFVEDDSGFVVPYLDIRAMANRVAFLLDSPDCRSTMGAAARRKVTKRHDISRAAPRIMDIIERTIARG
jgi:glycosyltransferase involved in cell wall biosynthesis